MAVRLHARLGAAAEPERLASAQDTALYFFEGVGSVAVGLVSQPMVGARARSKGNLYLVVAAAPDGAQRRQAAALVAEEVQRHYYYDESAGIGECLEKALRVADQRLRQQADRLGVATGSISVGAAVVREQELYLSTVGQAAAFMLRQARLLTLPDEGRGMGLPSADGHLLAPVWHGELSLGDTLALTTQELPRVIGTEELKSAVVTLHPQSAAEHLHNLYVAAGGEEASPLLIIEAAEAPATGVGHPLVPVRMPEHPAGVPERSPIPLADTVTERAAAIGGVARDAQDRARRGLSSLLGRAQDSLPRRQPPTRMVTPWPSRMETQRRLALAVIALLGVVAVLAGASWWFGGQQGPAPTISQVAEGEAALRQAQADLDRVFGAGSSMIETDPEQARRLLGDALEALDQAEAAGVATSATAPLRARAIAGLDELDGVVHVPVTLVADLASVVESPDIGDLVRGSPIENAAYVIERSTRTVYRVDLATGEASPIVSEGDSVGRATVGEPWHLARGGRDVVILDRGGSLWRWRPADAEGAGTLRAITVRGRADWGDDVIDVATFDRGAEVYNLYVLDPSQEQLLRYTPAADGSGYPSDPAGYLAAPAPLDGVRGIIVDGDVYLLLADEIERYQSGTKTGFRVTLPPDSDRRPGVDLRAFAGGATRRSGVLEAWDVRNGRILEFSKRTGEYVRQFFASGSVATFSDVRGMFLVEFPDQAPLLYWCSGSGLFVVTLEDPAALPTPTAEATPTPTPAE
jgi:hypothetical protein